jgi:hypothetical protein
MSTLPHEIADGGDNVNQMNLNEWGVDDGIRCKIFTIS